MQNAYCDFLSAVDTLKKDFPGLNRVDLVAFKLLECVAVRSEQGNAMTVSEAMHLSDLASPATLHRKIDLLRNAGLIEASYQGSNKRTKHLALTEDSQQYFTAATQLLSQFQLQAA